LYAGKMRMINVDAAMVAVVIGMIVYLVLGGAR
jgi:hypothetical protein